MGIQAAPADQEMSESTTAGVMEHLPLNAGAQAPRGMRLVLKGHRIARARWVEKTNVVKQKRFSELLQASLNKYANRSIEAAQVIEELIAMAKQFRDEAEKVAAMGLSVAEVAFYDALSNNQSAHDLMGDEVLMKMARELAVKLRGNLSIDWQYKENVRARLRTMIKALLKRYKYPPDQEAAAIDLVLQQTEMISEEWSRED